jgi:hypothetical protein
MGFQQSETAMQENNKRGSLGHETCDKVVASFLSLSGGSGSARSLDSPISSAPEVSHLGWGHWYTLRELEAATLNFGECNVLGEGGYGIVYKGQLPDSTMIAVKNLLNNRLVVATYPTHAPTYLPTYLPTLFKCVCVCVCVCFFCFFFFLFFKITFLI